MKYNIAISALCKYADGAQNNAHILYIRSKAIGKLEDVL